MTPRRALRFFVEIVFLGALAAAAIVADLRPLEIGGLMLAGWIVVALFEWTVSRALPHYGRGMTPRYYVPQVSLPPPRPLEQLPSGYPTADRDDAPTWIAPPALRNEMLGDEMLAEWPVSVSAPAVREDMSDERAFASPADERLADTWLDLEAIEVEGEAGLAPVEATAVIPLPEPQALVALPPVGEPEVDEAELVVVLPPVIEDEPEPVLEAVVLEEAPIEQAPAEEAPIEQAPVEEAPIEQAPVEEAPVEAVVVEEPAVEDVVVEPPAVEEPAVEEPAVEDVVAEPEPVAEAAVVEDEVTGEDALAGEPEPEPGPVALAEPEPVAEPEPEPEPEPPPVPVETYARHFFDPLAVPPQGRGRRFRRGVDVPFVEVLARPPRDGVLPGQARRER
jgi:hypothetical protein